MSLPEVGATTLLALAIIVGWTRYSRERVLWRRALELYLWLVPVSLAWLAAIHDAGGLTMTAVVGAVHLLVIIFAVWALGKEGMGRVSDQLAALAAVPLIVGSAFVWLAAVTFPGMELESIHDHNADHLFTTGFFFLGSAITLAGFTMLTALVRRSANSVLADLGLIAFLSGFTFWVIHLAFRGAVMALAAKELAATGGAPVWYASWRPWAGVMYGLYMTMAYLSIAAYGAAMLRSGWAGKGWGRAFVAFGLISTAGFLALGLFDLPLIPQFGPFVMGIILLRRSVREELMPAKP